MARTTEEKIIEPFERLLAIQISPDLPDNKPLRDVMPGIWPTLGDLRRLVEFHATHHTPSPRTSSDQ